MSDEANRELVGQLLLHVRDGLAPVVERVLTPLVATGPSWTVLLEERDRVAGRTGRYATTDLQSMLTAMAGCFGSLGFPFSDVLRGPADGLLPEEIRRVRNAWAHMGELSDTDTDCALDPGARLLALVEAPQAAAVDDLLDRDRFDVRFREFLQAG